VIQYVVLRVTVHDNAHTFLGILYKGPALPLDKTVDECTVIAVYCENLCETHKYHVLQNVEFLVLNVAVHILTTKL